MRHTLTMLESDYTALQEEIFGVPGLEGAAFLRCGMSRGPAEQRLLVRCVEPLRAEEYLVREPLRLSIASTAYARVAKRAATNREGVVFVHSHPTGIADFSRQDDREEPKLMRFLEGRLGAETLIGSLVISSAPSHTGRVWLNGRWEHMDVLRVIGQRFRFLGLDPDVDPRPEFFDRQIRAFGPDIQRALASLVVGVVGVGGTGSAVLAQLVRLGVGMVYLFDGQTFEGTNVNRVYGSSVAHADRQKTDIQEEAVGRVGLGTRVVNIPAHITRLDAARRLRECDLVFGCTDKERPRGILNDLVTRYLIPMFDTGVVVRSAEGQLEGIYGRVTTLVPGESCLFCRSRITSERIAAEGMDAEERQRLAKEGYIPELEGNDPAVIPFTTAVAAQAVMELLHRMTGFMGPDRHSSETLLFLHESQVRTNRTAAKLDCSCMQRELWARGDERDFLGLVWGG